MSISNLNWSYTTFAFWKEQKPLLQTTKEKNKMFWRQQEFIVLSKYQSIGPNEYTLHSKDDCLEQEKSLHLSEVSCSCDK